MGLPMVMVWPMVMLMGTATTDLVSGKFVAFKPRRFARRDKPVAPATMIAYSARDEAFQLPLCLAAAVIFP